MSIRIGSNSTSLAVQRNLSAASQGLSSSNARLASGLRINRASDDAAGLSIAAGLDFSARVNSQAVRNVNDGISVLSIAEAALSELRSINSRQRELAMQAANGTYAVAQRRAMDQEADALVNEYNRILAATEFNGANLFNPAAEPFVLHIGDTGTNTMVVGFARLMADTVGTGSFGNEQQIGAQQTPMSVHAADFNRDGRTDLVIGAYSGYGGHIVYGNGDGSFSASVTVQTGSAWDLLPVDLNNDGYADLVASNFGTTPRIYMNDGAGNFGGATNLPMPGNVLETAAADLNGDGSMDLAVGCWGPNNIVILQGDGSGTLTAVQTLAAPANPRGISFADVNDDGRLDMFVTSEGGSSSALYLGRDGGTFSQKTNIALGTLSNHAAFADINEDGLDDILVATDLGIMALQGNGDGSFSMIGQYRTGQVMFDLAVSDFNNDGHADFAANGSGNVYVFQGSGSGSFTQIDARATGAGAEGMASADINGDGVSDILATNRAAGTGKVRSYITNTRQSWMMPQLNLSSRENLAASLALLDEVSSRIQNTLQTIGAFQSRLATVAKVLQVRREEEESAQSRIMSADIASDSAAVVKASILQKAGASLLGQANQTQGIALLLLKSG